MKNILLLTSLYPSDEFKLLNGTSVCHYFVKEWQRMGYNVRVIYNYNTYPRFFYWGIFLFKQIIAANSYRAILYRRISKSFSYKFEDVLVSLIPIFKNRPGGKFSQRQINKQTSHIVNILNAESFYPDIILGHFLHPNIELSIELKKHYNVPIAVSLHGKIRKYDKKINQMLSDVDYVGFRSYPIKESFEKYYCRKPSFMCFSGIPNEYLTNHRHVFSAKVNRYLYVGNLMKRKYPTSLLEAAIGAFGKKGDYSLTFIGAGREDLRIKRIAIKNNILDKINLMGRISRDNVIKEMDDKADVFVMISENETFGLVHLEAMSRGCITIASRNEGMDGIIRDGVNGFLCNAGDSEELSRIMLRISKLKIEEIAEISSNAISTASMMTDDKMAYQYLHSILL